MKLLTLLALLGTSSAQATEGCIVVPLDENTIKDCSCDVTCKLCGYGTVGRNDKETYNTGGSSSRRRALKKDWPIGPDRCLVCADEENQMVEQVDG